MSHFPAGQVYSATPGFPGAKQTQKPALDTGEASVALYTATLNLGTGGASDQLIFTTEANRGRFFPIAINVHSVFGTTYASTSLAPNIFLGWQNPGKSNAYDNWLSNEGLQAVYNSAGQVFGPGFFDYTTLKSPTWNAFLSAPPSTPVYIRKSGGSIANDTRIIAVLGIYTG